MIERFVEGSCTVPTVSPSPKMLKKTYYPMKWGLLVKCRETILNDYTYRAVNCMSKNNSFVYLATGFFTYKVLYLKPSCSYLALFPLLDSMTDNSTGDAFKLLQQGFSLQYTSLMRISWIETIGWYAPMIGGMLLSTSLVNILSNFLLFCVIDAIYG
jgi:hypothetical protein